MTYVDRANAYVDGVLSGDIPACKWVRLACERQRRDLADPDFPYRFDAEAAEDICVFVEEFCPHIKGEWAGQPILLEDWQAFIYTTVFGWLDASGKRRFRTAYIEVPRKNAKSTMSAPVGLYMLGADREEGAEVYSAATTGDQARIVWDAASRMVAKSKPLRELGLEKWAHSVSRASTGGWFKPLNAESSTQDGLNVHCAIIDEVHAHKTRGLFDVLETATGARAQPLMWLITTAGSNRAGICYEQRTYVTKLLESVADDETYFGIIYTIDDGDDWTDPATWAKANPNWDVSVKPDDIERKARKAMQMPSATNNFLTKHLNVWVNADTAWMDMRAWEKCGDESLTLEKFAGKQCIASLDLASKVDIAAKVLVFREDFDDGPHYYAFGRYYLPEDAVEDGRNSQYSGWERVGRLVATPGNVTDYEYIKDDLRADSSRFEVAEVAFDPFQATQLSSELQAEGFAMVEMRPTVLNFSEPMKELEKLVLLGRFHHDGDPVLTWMISNVVCHIDAKENIYPRKERPENKIDGAVALIMALGRLLVSEDTASVYENRGLLVI